MGIKVYVKFEDAVVADVIVNRFGERSEARVPLPDGTILVTTEKHSCRLLAPLYAGVPVGQDCGK